MGRERKEGGEEEWRTEGDGRRECRERVREGEEEREGGRKEERGRIGDKVRK